MSCHFEFRQGRIPMMPQNNIQNKQPENLQLQASRLLYYFIPMHSCRKSSVHHSALFGNL